MPVARTNARKQSSLLSKEKAQVFRLELFLYVGAPCMTPFELLDITTAFYSEIINLELVMKAFLSTDRLNSAMHITL